MPPDPKPPTQAPPPENEKPAPAEAQGLAERRGESLQISNLVASIHSVCQNACIDAAGDLATACRCIIASHARIDDKALLLQAVAPGTFFDIERIDEMQTVFSKRNAVGDSDDWVELMLMLDFAEPLGSVLDLKKSIPCMYALHQSLTSVPKWSYQDTCRLFLLSNVEKLGYKYTISRFIGRQVGKMNTELCNKVMELMAEERHSQAAYQMTLTTVINGCTAKGSRLAMAMAAHRDLVQNRRNAWTMQGHARVKTRFSLIKLVEGLERDRQASSAADDTVDSTVTRLGFADFERRVRFPNSMSPLWRMRCYLLACQGHLFNFREHVAKVIPGQMCEAVCKQEVVIPEPADVSAAINTLALKTVPFKQLKDFKVNCFVGYVPSQLADLNMTNYLQLYVAAYQKTGIWKAVWKELYPIMSTQISKNVEAFVRDTPFAEEDFVNILKAGSPFH